MFFFVANMLKANILSRQLNLGDTRESAATNFPHDERDNLNSHGTLFFLSFVECRIEIFRVRHGGWSNG